MFKIIKKIFYNLKNIGKPKFTCPICRYNATFIDTNPPTGYRKYCRCPQCGSTERHRLQKLVLDKVFKNIDTSSMKILHFAPESFFKNYFQQRSNEYISADLFMENVDINCDMTNLPFADQEFDFVFASHVLERIQDDIKALTEVERVLKLDGIAILPVPIVSELTIKYPVQYETGHYRAPGKDYFECYKKVFSEVNLYYSSDFPEQYNMSPMGKPSYNERYDDIVPVCRS